MIDKLLGTSLKKPLFNYMINMANKYCKTQAGVDFITKYLKEVFNYG